MIQLVASKHHVQGFTLLELLIAIVVAGILASIAVPSFSDFLARQQLRSDVNEVISTLSLARSEAIRQRQTIEITIQGVTVCFDSLGARDSSTSSCNDCSSSCQLILEATEIGESRTVEVTPAGGIRVLPEGGRSQ